MTIDHDAIARAQVAIENGLIDALRSQQQADMDGTTVIVSRQACDEAAEFLPALYDEVKRLRAALSPFAKAGELFSGDPDTVEFDQCIYSPAAGSEYALCGDDLRRARQALKG